MIVGKPQEMVHMRVGRWLFQPLTSFWVVLFLALGAALVLSVRAAGPGVLPGDLAVARFVQSTPETGTGDIARLVNVLGATPGLLAVGTVIIVLLAARNRVWPASFILAAVLARGTNSALKAMFDSPRPTSDLVRVTEHSSYWGFPSGHTMGVVLLYGAILWVAPNIAPQRGWRIALQVTAWGMILMTGFARVYVGAHWPSDVLGAYLWGGVLLGMLNLGYGHAMKLACDRSRPGPVLDSAPRWTR